MSREFDADDETCPLLFAMSSDQPGGGYKPVFNGEPDAKLDVRGDEKVARADDPVSPGDIPLKDMSSPASDAPDLPILQQYQSPTARIRKDFTTIDW